MQDRITLDHAAGLHIETRPVERVSHLADQPPDRVARQPGIGVEGDHKANVGRHDGGGEKCRVRRAAQQPIELMQLAALALPPEPAPLGVVPLPTTVEQQKSIAARRGTIATVQSGDPAAGGRQKLIVVVGGLTVGVAPIGQQREMKLAVRARQIVDFELLHLSLYRFDRRQNRRDGDQRAQGFRHAMAKIERRQQSGAKTAGDHLVDPADGQVQRRNEAQNAEQDEKGRAHAAPRTQPEGKGQKAGRDHDAGAHVAADAERAIKTLRPRAPRRMKADLGRETGSPGGEQIVAGVAPARVGPAGIRPPSGGADRRLGDLKLGQRASARQFLNGAAIEIAGRKIHLRKSPARLEHFIHQAEAFKQFGPIHVGNEPHAGDDVAHGDAAGDLPLVLIANHRVGGRRLAGQLVVEPGQGGRDARILIAQAMDQLHQIAVGKRHLASGRQHRVGELDGVAGGAQQPIRRQVGGVTPGATVDHPLGDPSKVLDEHDPQGDGDRPEFTDGERLHFLIGAQIAADDVGIEQAVGVRHERPGQAEHARVVGERPAGELGQLPVIADRQINADVADLFLNHVEIIDQPFGGRCYRFTFINTLGDVAIGGHEHRLVIGETCGKGGASAVTGDDPLRRGEAAGMLLQTFDTEQFGADRRFVVPRGRRAGVAQQTAEGSI